MIVKLLCFHWMNPQGKEKFYLLIMPWLLVQVLECFSRKILSFEVDAEIMESLKNRYEGNSKGTYNANQRFRGLKVALRSSEVNQTSKS